jgi:hypothetical protein
MIGPWNAPLPFWMIMPFSWPSVAGMLNVMVAQLVLVRFTPPIELPSLVRLSSKYP